MEKYIIGESSIGKTRKALEEAKENNAVVVCKYPLHMQNKANSYGILGLEFVSYEDLAANVVDSKKIVIDEIGEFFKHCYGLELASFTMTVD